MSASTIEERARAKINLSLRIMGRRADGYHELQSLVVFADAGDRLVAAPSDELSLSVTGPFAPALRGEPDNLVLRAARELREALGLSAGAHLTLEKNLPVASGIGGGSADAAAALRGLTRLWGAEPGEAKLASIALCLGADVPVCLDAAPALMWGVGELMTRVDALPRFYLVLANPGIALSTASVFRALQAQPLQEMPIGPELPPFPSLDALVIWLGGHGNDLEAPARRLAPEIASVIAAIAATPGCRLARMSGSGATCFGLFAGEGEARAAAADIAGAHPGWWVTASAVAARGVSG